MSFLRFLRHSNIGQHNKGMPELKLERIVSGGQTGVDRAALDVSIESGVPHGGWCPKGRKAEDGTIPSHYQLDETETDDYSERTKRNIQDANATLIIVPSIPTKVADGTILTINQVKKANKPYLIVALSDSVGQAEKIFKWMNQNANIRILNVAGPRESQAPGIYKASSIILVKMIKILERNKQVKKDAYSSYSFF